MVAAAAEATYAHHVGRVIPVADLVQELIGQKR